MKPDPSEATSRARALAEKHVQSRLGPVYLLRSQAERDHWNGEVERLANDFFPFFQRIETLEAALRALNDIVPQIDNGYCAICRLAGDHGYRSYNHRAKGLDKFGRCSNEECISHQVRTALAGEEVKP